MVTYRFMKDIHDARIREIERSVSQRSKLPESEQTLMVRRQARARWATPQRSGQAACAAN